MLVVTRKKDQSVIILQGNIEITVLEVKNGQVKLGIEAPDNIKIFRKEMIEQTEAENKSSLLDSTELDLAILKGIIIKKD